MGKKHSRLQRLFKDYRIIIQDESDFHEKGNFKTNPVKATVILICALITIFFISYYLIAYTNLSNNIPGYSDINMRKELIRMQKETDSLNNMISNNAKYYENIQNILSGDDNAQENTNNNSVLGKNTNSQIQNDNSTNNNSKNKIADIDSRSLNNFELNTVKRSVKNMGISNLTFYPPIKGVISSNINIAENHFGTDIIPVKSDVVKSTLDGVVIFSGWTLETGNVIIISHLNNIISVYKHNSTLLKKEDDYVKAGEPIAIAGNSGELSSGPHLHFELWYENRPVNAREFITF